MSATASRRGVLAFLGAAPIAAAAGGASPARTGLLRRLSPGFVGDLRGERYAGLNRFADELYRTGIELPDSEPLNRLAAALDPPTDALLGTPVGHALPRVTCRAIAALAPAFPAEIAAYRSFGAPMRRRLYAQMLERESARLTGLSDPPPTPPASPGPDA